MKVLTRFIVMIAAVLFSFTATAESDAVKIKRAMSAAPSSISQDATIMDTDGTLLKKGTNGWTCLPDVMPNDKNPMCNTNSTNYMIS